MQEEVNSTQGEKKQTYKGLLDGSVLTSKKVVKQLPFILFLFALAIVYIFNSYHAEELLRKINKLQSDIKDLRSEAITLSSERMFRQRYGEIKKLIEFHGINLKESTTPPKKFVIRKKK